MLNQLDYVRITLSDGSQKEGYLTDITEQVGTLAGRNGNTAFNLPTTTIELLYAGNKPAMQLPTSVKPSRKPYHVAALVGTHTACEDYFQDEQVAKRYAQSLVGQWTNNVPDKKSCQFTSILVLTTEAYAPVVS